MLVRAAGVVLLAFCVAAAAIPAGATKDVEKTLTREWGQKVIFLRHAYRGTQLRYNSNGELVEGGRAGVWGLDGALQVTRVRLRGTTLEIEGNRAIVGYDLTRRRTEANLTPEKMHVEITLDPMHQSNEDINRVLSNVFVSGSEQTQDLVPAYWKAFVEHKIAARQEEGRTLFIITELESIRLPKNPGPEWERPRPRDTPDPIYPESARQHRVEGTSLLEIVVDHTGSVQDINIVRPIGSGLDEMAVDAVSKWRFEPAKKNGQAVQVAMFVEVSFRLF